MGGSRIVGTGSCLPRRVVENSEIGFRLNVKPQYISRVSGVRTRHWVSEDENCSQLAEQATRQALDMSGLTIQDIDAILFSTTSPDIIFPSTACILQNRLGLRHIPAFDLVASCAGFLYGLSMADCFIRSGQFHRCLVVAAEVKSRYLNPLDDQTAILFGDGAGAAIVVREERAETGILAVRLYSDGGFGDLVKVPAGGSRLPTSAETVQQHLHTIQLQGASLYRIAVKRLGLAVQELLNEQKVSMSELSQVIFHQANGRMLATLGKRLGISQEQMFSNIERIGNTSSASLPIALDEANRQGRIPSEHLVFLGAFGGGLTWGTALIRWSAM